MLSTPGARIGVIVNDFGELNVDAMLVAGEIHEPVSIAGGCICCLPDDGGIDDALTKLTDPRLDLDAVIVEASGLADPVESHGSSASRGFRRPVRRTCRRHRCHNTFRHRRRRRGPTGRYGAALSSS